MLTRCEGHEAPPKAIKKRPLQIGRVLFCIKHEARKGEYSYGYKYDQ